jgi:tetratricopeptide (TPR) repeat protein
MKKILVALTICSLLFILLALWFYPSSSELIHVFRAENRSSEFLRVYEKLDLSPSRALKIKLARDLMAMGDRRGLLFAADLLREEFHEKLLQECILFASGNKERQTHLDLLEIAYKATLDLDFLNQKVALYSYFGMPEKHQETLRRIALLNPDPELLKQLYFGGSKKFVKEFLMSRLEKLSTEEKLQLYRYYTWDNELKQAYELATDHIPLEDLEPGILRDLKDLALYFSDPDQALRIMEYKVKLSPSPDDLVILAQLYDYMGDISRTLQIYSKLYEKTLDVSYLRLIAQNHFDHGDLVEYATALREILTLEYDHRLYQEIFYTLIDAAGLEDTLEFLNKGDRLSKQAGWFVSQEDKSGFGPEQTNFKLQVLWAMERKEEAVKILLTGNPANLSNDWLSLIYTVQPSEEQLPFLQEHFKKSRQIDALERIWRIALMGGNLEGGRKRIRSMLDLSKPRDLTDYLLTLPDDLVAKELDVLASREANRDVLYRVMTEAMGRSLHKLAKRAAEELLSREPKNGEVLLLLSKLHLWKDETQKARQYFALYTEIDPNHGLARFQLGLGALEKQKEKEALEHFKVALKGLNEPGQEFHKAYATWKVKGAEEAVPLFKNLFKTMKDPYILTTYLSVLDEAGKDEEFQSVLDQLDSKTQTNPDVLALVGNFQSRRKRYEEAAETFVKLSQTIPQDDLERQFEALSQIGYQEELAGNNQAAVESYSKALAIREDKIIRSSVEWLQTFIQRQASIKIASKDGVLRTEAYWMQPRRKYRIGGYLRDTGGVKKAEVFLEELEQARYRVSLGNGLHSIKFNSKVEAEWSREQYIETKEAVDEKIHRSYLGIAKNFHLKPNLNLRAQLARIGYRSPAGKIAGYQNTQVVLRLDQPSKNSSYSAELTNSSLIQSEPNRSNVGFSDYRALSLLREWNSGRKKDRRVEYATGVVWDFKNIAPVVRSAVETKSGFRLGGGWSYDPFRKGGVAEWDLRYKRKY